jgi:uncharacterized membrane protein YdcZ (DUF606 family)
MLPLQFGINAQLASWVGGPLRATLISFVVGAAVLLVATLFFARGPGPEQRGWAARRGGSGPAVCSAPSTCSAAS